MLNRGSVPLQEISTLRPRGQLCADGGYKAKWPNEVNLSQA